MLKDIHRYIDELYPEMVEIRRYLHQYPELSFKEHKTAQYIIDFYNRLDIPYEKNVGGNGVIATLKGGKPGKTIALRADFDALPIQDEKEVSYKSKVPGIMHACGHDGHTASLLSLAKTMKHFQNELPGTIVFVHQHAEEIAPGGAKPIVDSGAIDHVEAVFGSHLWATVPFGEVQTSKDVFMAGADHFEIKIQGKGGHGAAPHETKDSIVIASELIGQLQTIVSRRIDPLETAVVTVGSLNAGHSFNIIADKADIIGTVRYLKKDIQFQIINEMERIIKGVCISHDASYTFNYNKGYPPLLNHADEAELILNSALKIKEINSAKEVVPSMGAEDFTYYLQKKPGAYFFTGAEKEGYSFPHHHPKFDFDERVLPVIAKILIQAYYDYQNN